MKTAGRGRIRLPLVRPPCAVDRPLSADPDCQALRVGTVTHEVIAELCRLRDRDGADLLEEAWSLAGQAVVRAGLGRGARAGRLAAAGAAAVYVQRFMPPAPWRWLGSEIDLGEHGRVDLAWEAEVVLFDEIKTGDAAAVRQGEGPTARQVDRYTRAGAARYGVRFAGVRLIYPAIANRSRLVLPDGRAVPLGETAYRLGRKTQ
jgi:hypothetical protein